MMNNFLRISLFSLLSLTLSACSAFNVSTDFNPSLDTSQWKTYQWKLAELNPDDPYDNDLNRNRVIKAVNSELKTQGFKLSKDSSDFNVSYFFLVEPKVDIHRHYNHRCPWADCRYHRYETYISEYKYGSIVVDISDGTTGELQWRGVAGSRISEGATPQKREQNIQAAIKELMAEFPPNKAEKTPNNKSGY